MPALLGVLFGLAALFELLVDVELGCPALVREQAFRPQQHHQHQGEPVEQELELDELEVDQVDVERAEVERGEANRLEERVEVLQDDGLDHEHDERTHGDAPDVAHAAEDDHGQYCEGHREQELVR